MYKNWQSDICFDLLLYLFTFVSITYSFTFLFIYSFSNIFISVLFSLSILQVINILKVEFPFYLPFFLKIYILID